MTFKLRLTDEMIGELRSPELEDMDAGLLIRALIDSAEGKAKQKELPLKLEYVMPIFLGQIERARERYSYKLKTDAERQRRFRNGKNNRLVDTEPE